MADDEYQYETEKIEEEESKRAFNLPDPVTPPNEKDESNANIDTDDNVEIEKTKEEQIEYQREAPADDKTEEVVVTEKTQEIYDIPSDQGRRLSKKNSLRFYAEGEVKTEEAPAEGGEAAETEKKEGATENGEAKSDDKVNKEVKDKQMEGGMCCTVL